MLTVRAACACAAGGVAAAGAAAGTAYAFAPALFGAVHIKRGKAHNQNNYCCYYNIRHCLLLYFAAASSRSVRTHSHVIMPAITSTAARPGRKAAPTAPVLIRVPS